MASDVGEVVEKVKSASIAEQAQQVWLSIEEDDAWCKATFVKRDGDKVTVKRDDGAEVVLEAEAFGKLPVYFEPTGPPVEDLTKLGDVNDATMLDTLRRRYAADDIFTSIGPVCIALNPYRPVACCSSEAIKSLVDDAGKEETPPHAFKVAQSAFYQLQHAHEAQSILISGESGAGKTETNKICLVCLAELSHSSGRATDACLEASLLLETFGNAKTVYNDNSSRFGKWCAVQFSDDFKIASCANSFYLLELSRVVSAPAGERNYHLFYQMLAGSTAEEKKELELLGGPADYGYLSGGVFTINNVDDSKDWEETRAKLEMLEVGGTGRDAQVPLMRLFSGVLALGNVSFEKGEAPPGLKVDAEQTPHSTKIPDHHDRAAVRNHTVAGQNLQKLAELEEPELKKLKEKQLRAVAEHLNIIYDRKRYNHKKDKDHLVSMILSKQTDGMAADSSDLLDAWGV